MYCIYKTDRCKGLSVIKCQLTQIKKGGSAIELSEQFEKCLTFIQFNSLIVWTRIIFKIWLCAQTHTFARRSTRLRADRYLKLSEPGSKSAKLADLAPP